MIYIEIDQGYIFAIIETNANGVADYQFVSLKKHPYPYVHIQVDHSAVVEALNYYKSGFEVAEEGTVAILKTALSYVRQKHTGVCEFMVQDETFVNVPEKPLITGRRLLQGKLGWYEEHLGAVASDTNTEKLLRYLTDPVKRASFVIPEEDNLWWTANRVVSICREIKCPRAGHILGTVWRITPDVIDSYGIKYQIVKIGGGERKVERILKNAERYPAELMLTAKHRNPLLELKG